MKVFNIRVDFGAVVVTVVMYTLKAAKVKYKPNKQKQGSNIRYGES